MSENCELPHATNRTDATIARLRAELAAANEDLRQARLMRDSWRSQSQQHCTELAAEREARKTAERQCDEYAAALVKVCADYQRAIDEMAAHNVHPSADVLEAFGTLPAAKAILSAHDKAVADAAARKGAAWALNEARDVVGWELAQQSGNVERMLQSVEEYLISQREKIESGEVEVDGE